MRALLLGSLWVAALSLRAQQPFDLDPSFQTEISKNTVSSIAILPDGDLLLSGRFRLNGEFNDRSLYRVHNDGSGYVGFPFSFGGGRITPWNGRYYVANGDAVVRVFDDGTLDNGFIWLATGPYVSINIGGDYYAYPDGRILLSGTHYLSDTARGYVGLYNLIWFSNQGYLDTTAHHRVCDGHINYIHPLPDGKFLLGGFWSEYDGTPTPNSTHLIRVFPDGALDTTFQCPIDWGSVVCHEQLPDGKHLVCGTFTVNNDPDTMQVLRLLPDGGVDAAFNSHLQYLYPYASATSYAGVIGLLPMDQGRHIITGGFTTIGGLARGGIALLDSSGDLLPDRFDQAACGVWNDGFMDHAYLAGIVPAPDGSFYIHGSYHGYNDGTTNFPGQRMVSRLYGLDVGMQERPVPRPALYPNPAYTTFRVQDAGAAPLDLVLHDALGRPVRQWLNTTPGNDLTVDDLPEGLYFLQLRGPHPCSLKLLIQRP